MSNPMSDDAILQILVERTRGRQSLLRALGFHAPGRNEYMFLRRYLQSLRDRGLIAKQERPNEHTLWRITGAGLEFLAQELPAE